MDQNDFQTPEIFKAQDGVFKGSLIPMVLLGVPLLLMSWLLFALVMNAVKAPAANWLGLLAAIAFTALMVWVRLRKTRQNVSEIELLLEPRGLTYTGDASRRFLSWQDLREARRVLPLVGMDAKKAARGVGYDSMAAKGGQAGVNALGQVGAQLTAGTGLVGIGTMEILGGAMARETHRQNEGRNGRDPQTGQPYLTVPLSQFDTRWDRHRIGEWLAHFRPDLAAQATALHDGIEADSQKSLKQTAQDAWAEGRAERAARESNQGNDPGAPRG
ncbi:hypothetical protein CGZ93_13370 [Enemella dayhoffiae]|uniref:Uncharacterized protein n=1 Tax=Enemella dayhoffiae TaxID=2016507 RepID=A0A255H068_9ACTN|nr:hypothetical protein [Enemella dayhoffiae]OYO19354.1 hypothetical protein CGZ93_13370 [Enemella dayhoffiae]